MTDTTLVQRLRNMGPYPCQAAELAADEIERLAAELAEARKVIKRIPNAMNDAFAAGMEEREFGSAKRQERYMKSVEALRDAAQAFLASKGE